MNIPLIKRFLTPKKFWIFLGLLSLCFALLIILGGEPEWESAIRSHLWDQYRISISRTHLIFEISAIVIFSLIWLVLIGGVLARIRGASGFLVVCFVLSCYGIYTLKKTAARAGCILNQRNVQQAMRGYQGVRNLSMGSPLDRSVLIGPNGYMSSIKDCSSGTYTWESKITPYGVLYLKCSNPEHEPVDHKDW